MIAIMTHANHESGRPASAPNQGLTSMSSPPTPWRGPLTHPRQALAQHQVALLVLATLARRLGREAMNLSQTVKA